MFQRIIEFFKNIFKKDKILKIDSAKENEKNYKNPNNFQDELKGIANDRTRLLNLQKDLKEGKILEKDLESKDIRLLKELYCKQILELYDSVQYYAKKMKA